jgi:Family of unknown function (DUF6463)
MNPASNPRPRITVGAMLVGIALIHTVFGVAIGSGLDPSVAFEGEPALTAMLADGVVDSVGGDPWRAAITWFLLWGLVLGLLGLEAHQSERAGVPPSRSFALGLAALCVLGVVLMPASGFWLGFVPALFAYRRAMPAGTDASAVRGSAVA